MHACRCVGVRAECRHTYAASHVVAFTRHHHHQGPSPPDALGVVPIEPRAPCGRDWAGPQSPKTANRRPRALDPLACCERSHLARWRVAEVDAGSSRALTLLSLLSLLSLLPSLHDQDSPPPPTLPLGWLRVEEEQVRAKRGRRRRAFADVCVCDLRGVAAEGGACRV
jgi:hypothetical protein